MATKAVAMQGEAHQGEVLVEASVEVIVLGEAAQGEVLLVEEVEGREEAQAAVKALIRATSSCEMRQAGSLMFCGQQLSSLRMRCS